MPRRRRHAHTSTTNGDSGGSSSSVDKKKHGTSAATAHGLLPLFSPLHHAKAPLVQPSTVHGPGALRGVTRRTPTVGLEVSRPLLGHRRWLVGETWAEQERMGLMGWRMAVSGAEETLSGGFRCVELSRQTIMGVLLGGAVGTAKCHVAHGWSRFLPLAEMVYVCT